MEVRRKRTNRVCRRAARNRRSRPARSRATKARGFPWLTAATPIPRSFLEIMPTVASRRSLPSYCSAPTISSCWRPKRHRDLICEQSLGQPVHHFGAAGSNDDPYRGAAEHPNVQRQRSAQRRQRRGAPAETRLTKEVHERLKIGTTWRHDFGCKFLKSEGVPCASSRIAPAHRFRSPI